MVGDVFLEHTLRAYSSLPTSSGSHNWPDRTAVCALNSLSVRHRDSYMYLWWYASSLGRDSCACMGPMDN